MIRRSIVAVTADNFSQLPSGCHACGYWESDQPASLQSGSAHGESDKQRWYRDVLESWGNCGKIVVQSNQALAYCCYAPSACVPQACYYTLAPVSRDAIFLACLYVPEPFRGRGLGKLLLSAVQKDLIKRGYRAVETFARRAPARNPSGWTEFYLANGWQIVKDSGSLALLRLDLRAAVTWQVNLDAVLEGLTIPRPAKVPMS